MRKLFTYCLLQTLAFSTVLAVMQTPALAHKHHGHEKQTQITEFTENKSQWNQAVKFAADFPGARVFLEKQGITFALYDIAKADEIQHRPGPGEKDGLIDAHAYRVKFLNSNNAAVISGKEKTSGFKNYFIGNDQTKWASNVASFHLVEYKNIYPQTDLHILENNGRMKYEYILQPGADHTKIRMQYEGVDGIMLQNGELHLKTSLNTVIEQKPYVYQVKNGLRTEVPSRFILKNGVVSFDLPMSYDKSLPLIIDPLLVFSTYTGSTAGNYGYTAAFDDLGFVYSGGIVFGPGFPTTTGAYQFTFAGNTDMGLIKYNPNAQQGSQSRVWATYIGGSQNADHPHSIVTNSNRELIVFGSSGQTNATTNNFPTTTGAFDTTFNGRIDIVVAKLSADGSVLLGSTYAGGAQDDGQTPTSLFKNYGDTFRGDVTVDDQDNIYFASMSNSGNFPVINGFQTVKGTDFDGVACKLTPDLTSIVWSSFLGGDGDDAAYSVQVTSMYDVVIAGGTMSSDLPGTAGAPFQAYQGLIDAFVARISSTGSTLIRTSYAGTDQYDQAYFVQLDGQDAAFLFGQTLGGYAISPNIYSNPGSGQFLHKFSPDLSVSLLSTTIGNTTGNLNLSPTAFLVDDCGQILLSGYGGGLGPQDYQNLPFTPDALQQTATGGGFYVMQLMENFHSLKYASYLGNNGPHVDGGTSRFDKKGNIYQSSCVNGGWPLTPNAWSTTHPGGYNNGTLKMAITELDAEFTVTPAIGDTLNPLEGCAPFTLNFERISAGGQFYLWNFGDGQDTVTADPVTHTYTTPGQYIVTHYLFDSTTCQGSDHVSKTIIVHGPTGTGGPDMAICNSSSVNLEGAGGVTYLWSPATGLSSNSIATPTASPSVTTSYTVTITDANGCVAVDTVTVGVGALPNLTMPGPQGICAGDSVVLSITGNPDYSYSWSPSTGLNVTDSSTVLANPLATTTYFVDVNYDGCTARDSVLVTVNPAPAVAATPDQLICAGVPIILTATGANTYTWFPGNSLNVTTGDNVVASPMVTTTYTIVGTSAAGCSDTTTVTLTTGTVQAIASNNSPLCEGSTITLQANLLANATYSWTGPAGFSSQLQNPQLNNVTPQMEGTYTLTVTTPGCDPDTATTDVIVYTYPVVTTNFSDTTICQGNTAVLRAFGAVTYSWYPSVGLGSTTGNTVEAFPATDQTYTVVGINPGGCTDSSTVTVFVNSVNPAAPLADVEICPGTSTTLFATEDANYTYSWLPAEGLSSTTVYNPTVTPANTTEYILNISANGCRLPADTVLVAVSTEPTISVMADYATGPVPHAVQFTNTTTGANGFTWNFGDGGTSNDISPVHTYTEAGTYTVSLTYNFGSNCTNTIDVESITVEPVSQPNIFTPNGDGINDEFKIYFTKKPFKLTVMNRWGGVVKEINDYHLHQNWNGDNLPDGLYFYQVTTTDGEDFKGWVEILR